MIATSKQLEPSRRTRSHPHTRPTLFVVGLGVLITVTLVLAETAGIGPSLLWFTAALLGLFVVALFLWTALTIDDAVREGLVRVDQACSLTMTERRRVWRWVLRHHRESMRTGVRADELVARVKADIDLDVPVQEMELALDVASFAWSATFLERGRAREQNSA